MPFFLLYCLLTGRRLGSLRQRFGFLPAAAEGGTPVVWVHAASVGEVRAARSVLTEMGRQRIAATVVVTTVTQQGNIAARRELGPDVRVYYAPLDLPWVVRRFIQAVNPRVYVCLETELWPTALRLLDRHGAALLLLNGRMSERSFRRYARFRNFFSQIIGRFQALAVISRADRKRFELLGASPERIRVCGNIKYDLGRHFPGEKERRRVISRLRGLLRLNNSGPVLVAGSTHGGEEQHILDARALLKEHLPGLTVILAPRHLERLAGIERLLAQQGVTHQLYSGLEAGKRAADVILVDRMGELAALYAVADYAFCGGSLVDKGGHNIMEPAVWGKPPFHGPHMKDFADARALLEKERACYPVRSAKELAEQILYLERHPRQYAEAGVRAAKVARAQQGAAAKQVELIKSALAGSGPRASATQINSSAGNLPHESVNRT